MQISNEVSDEGRTGPMKSALISHELRENAKQSGFRLNTSKTYSNNLKKSNLLLDVDVDSGLQF